MWEAPPPPATRCPLVSSASARRPLGISLASARRQHHATQPRARLRAARAPCHVMPHHATPCHTMPQGPAIRCVRRQRDAQRHSIHSVYEHRACTSMSPHTGYKVYKSNEMGWASSHSAFSRMHVARSKDRTMWDHSFLVPAQWSVQHDCLLRYVHRGRRLFILMYCALTRSARRRRLRVDRM